VTFYTGIFFKEYDKEKAESMLEILKTSDETLFRKITEEKNPDYMKEYRSIYTKKGNPVLIVYGAVLIILSVGCLAPAAIAFHTLANKDQDDIETQEKEKNSKSVKRS
jgi:hypothetical protein